MIFGISCKNTITLRFKSWSALSGFFLHRFSTKSRRSELNPRIFAFNSNQFHCWTLKSGIFVNLEPHGTLPERKHLFPKLKNTAYSLKIALIYGTRHIFVNAVSQLSTRMLPIFFAFWKEYIALCSLLGHFTIYWNIFIWRLTLKRYIDGYVCWGLSVYTWTQKLCNICCDMEKG